MANRWPPDNRYPRDRSPPPRGPRNSYDTGRGPGLFAPRGRGFGARGDFARGDLRDRELPPRDTRDSPPPAWGADRGRTWRDRDYDRPPPRRLSPPRGRPPPPDLRDNDRYVPDRNLGLGRGRRSSREDIFPSPQSAPLRDNGPPQFRGRGGFLRGRGRGDFDPRDRRPGSFGTEREVSRARSRSPRDERWERDSNRDGRDVDRRDERRPAWREGDRSADRTDREREPDRFRRDPFPPNDSRRTSAPTSRSETPHSAPQSAHPAPPAPPPLTRQVQDPAKDAAVQRRVSSFNASTMNREVRPEGPKLDFPVSRIEASSRKYPVSGASSPMQVPQVPAFGSAWNHVGKAPTEPKPPAAASTESKSNSETKVPVERKASVELKTPTEPRPQAQTQALQAPIVIEPHAASPGPLKLPPTAPKAQLERLPPAVLKLEGEKLPPTAPRAERIPEPVVPVARAAAVPPPPPPPSAPASHSTGRFADVPALNQTQQAQSSFPPFRELPQTSPRTLTNQLRSPHTLSRPYPHFPSGPQNAPRPEPHHNVQAPFKPPGGPLATSPNTTTFSPPLGPRGGSSFGANVPTGPKAERTQPPAPIRAPTGPAHGPIATRQWTRPPPIMPTFRTGLIVPAKRDAQGEEKERFGYQAQRQETSVKTEENRTIDALISPLRSPAESVIRSPVSGRSTKQSPVTSTHPAISAPSPVPKEEQLSQPDQSLHEKTPQLTTQPAEHDASGGLMDNEDAMLLDDMDLEKQEAEFQKRKADLEAQKVDLSSRRLRAATPLESLAFLGRMMLDQIAAEPLPDLVPGAKQQLLTPKAEESDNVEMANVASPARSTPSIGSPELRSLPFLAQAPLTPLSDLDIFQDHSSRYEQARSTIAAAMARLSDERTKQDDVLCDEYAILYRPWKEQCNELDSGKDQDERREQVATVPQAAVAIVETPTTPAATLESRRGRGGNSTEYDLQKVLEESMLTATIENLNREKEALGSRPDYDREAVIPDLLTEEEQISRSFQDTSRRKAPDHAVKFFQLAPTRDDFTEEEHRILVQAYQLNPKQFGIIARELPGRNYKECLNHYYATKWSGEYKPPPNKRKRKGRLNKGGFPVPGRPKANALISNRTDIYDQEDYTNAVVAVTDSGRPRRAAAPVFGEKESDESGAQGVAQPIVRRGPKPDASGEPGFEKPKKPRGQTREKSQRKVKPLPTPRHLSMSPEKPEIDSKHTIHEAPPVAALNSVEFDAASGLAAMQLGQAFAPPIEMQQRLPSVFDSPRQLAATLTPEVSKIGLPPKIAGTASSYWSKQEERDFPRYLAHFGTDWQAIAQEMGTKTHTMVKNYYNRLLQSRPDFQETADRANDRRSRGETVGAPPTPGMPTTKRRTEPSQPAAPRALAPHKEVNLNDERATNAPLSFLNRPVTDLHGYPVGPDGLGSTETQDDRTLAEDGNRRNGTPPNERLPTHPSGRLEFAQDRRNSGPSPTPSFSHPVASTRPPGAPLAVMPRSEFEYELNPRRDARAAPDTFSYPRSRIDSIRGAGQSPAFGQLQAQYQSQSPQQDFLRPAGELSRARVASDDRSDMERRFLAQPQSATSPRMYAPRYSMDVQDRKVPLVPLGYGPTGSVHGSSSRAEERRTSLTPASGNSLLALPASKPEPRKTSNLASILNSDEPRGPRRSFGNSAEIGRTKSPQPLAYQAGSQPLLLEQQHERRDPFSSQPPFQPSSFTSLHTQPPSRPAFERDGRDPQGVNTLRSDWASRAGWTAGPSSSRLSGGYGYNGDRGSDTTDSFNRPRPSISGMPPRDGSERPQSAFGYGGPRDGPATQQHAPPPSVPAKYLNTSQPSLSHSSQPSYTRPPLSPPAARQNQQLHAQNMAMSAFPPSRTQHRQPSTTAQRQDDYHARQQDPQFTPHLRDDPFQDAPRRSRENSNVFPHQHRAPPPPPPPPPPPTGPSGNQPPSGPRDDRYRDYRAPYLANPDAASPRPAQAQQYPAPPTGPSAHAHPELRYSRQGQAPPMDPPLGIRSQGQAQGQERQNWLSGYGALRPSLHAPVPMPGAGARERERERERDAGLGEGRREFVPLGAGERPGPGPGGVSVPLAGEMPRERVGGGVLGGSGSGREREREELRR